ncbi:NAD(P)H-binding protein [Nocardioides nanhaiensis]|uniref:SDR family oxidoreductase n=1 Tax=Nocardioides nanhaiensis TaxID=1476871 RepID=A0ABP8W3P2_9ACTN
MTTEQTDADVLMIGCGDLGARIGLRLADVGHRVLALRRRADLVPAPLQALSVDLTAETPSLPSLDLRYLVVALTARPRSEESYRATYVEGLRRALDAVEAAGKRPERAVLVSSTGVYGEVPDGTLVDEDLEPTPADGPARMLLESERLFAERLPGGTVLRCSGLYDGAAPSRMVERVAAGEVDDVERWTNRIHRDDAAAAAVHLLTRDDPPADVYLGNDDEPALLGEVAAEIARRIGAPAPPAADPARAHGKRISNARLRATGWEPQYPSHREGYASSTR